MNLTIDQKMEYLRKSLEMGAKFSISFHDVRDQEEAEKIVSALSQLLHADFTECHSGVFNWFKIDGPIQTAVFFDKEKYMEEDVNFDMESGDRIA